jgi:hypothetical protein
VQRWTFAEGCVELAGVHTCDLGGVDRPDPALQLERPGERLLDGDLLIEDEADQEGDGLGSEERIGLVVAREVKPVRVGGLGCHKADSMPPPYRHVRHPTRASVDATLESGRWEGVAPI